MDSKLNSNLTLSKGHHAAIVRDNLAKPELVVAENVQKGDQLVLSRSNGKFEIVHVTKIEKVAAEHGEMIYVKTRSNFFFVNEILSSCSMVHIPRWI